MERDRAAFQQYWLLSKNERRMHHVVGLEHEFSKSSLLLMEEADQLIFDNPQKACLLFQEHPCACFTATPHDGEGGLEHKILSQLNIKLLTGGLEQGNLEFTGTIDTKLDHSAVHFIGKRLLNRPGLVYCSPDFYEKYLKTFDWLSLVGPSAI
jgi:hypothetical protein